MLTEPSERRTPMFTNDNNHSSFYEYRFFSHSFCPEDTDPCLAYGITLYRTCDDAPQIVDRIPAITTRKEKITWITDLLNRTQVSPIHFRDVIEDLLASGISNKYAI